MLDSLTLEVFAKYLNQTFRLHHGSETMEVELTEAKDLGPGSKEGGRNAFSLIFRGAKEPVLDQQIYKIEHGEMGSVELFLVPVGQDEAGTLYQAIFN